VRTGFRRLKRALWASCPLPILLILVVSLSPLEAHANHVNRHPSLIDGGGLGGVLYSILPHVELTTEEYACVLKQIAFITLLQSLKDYDLASIAEDLLEAVKVLEGGDVRAFDSLRHSIFKRVMEASEELKGEGDEVIMIPDDRQRLA
jgi:hypothetical protein